jgi:hypothetical protein
MARMRHGSPVLDVEITAEDWEQAKQSKSGGCLIQHAIQRAYPHLARVSVDMATIRASDYERGERYTYLTPSDAQLVLLYFDQGWSQPVEKLTVKRAVKIDPMVRSKSNVARAERRRAERKAELEEKIEAGEELTTGEKSAYTKVKNAKPAPKRAEAYGRAEVKNKRVVHGGKPIRAGRDQPNPNLLRGTDRHFGAKQAKPGVVFEEAVEKAVELRLREQA